MLTSVWLDIAEDIDDDLVDLRNSERDQTDSAENEKMTWRTVSSKKFEKMVKREGKDID